MAAPVNSTGEVTPDDRQRRVRRFVYGLILAIAAGQGLGNILTATVLYSPAHWPDNRPPDTPLFSANDRSRWCTVWSLVERGTFEIDEIIAHPGWDTIDKVRQHGHFYSSKPALLPVVTAGFYWLLKHGAGLDLLTETHATVRALLLIVNWIPMLVALALTAAIGERYARTDWSRYFLVLSAAFATLLTPFLVTLNNHSIAACSALFAIYPWLRISIDGERRAGLFAWAGFWGAFTVCNELPACVFGAALFVLLVRTAPAPTLKFFVPAALVPLAAFMATTRISSGEWLPMYAKFGTEAYNYVLDGVPSYWMNPSGLDRSVESPLTYLLHCTLGHHGIFSLTPIFLLTAVGWIRIGKLTDAPLRSVCWMSLGMTVWVLGFYLTQTRNYNYGGNSSGLRWAFWLIPFLLAGLVPVLDQWGDRRWLRVTSGILLVISVVSATLPRNNPWRPPWLQTLFEELAWVDYSTRVEAFDAPRRCWFGPLPAAGPQEPEPWIEFMGDGPLGQSPRLRLKSVAREQIAGTWIRKIEADVNAPALGASGASSFTFEVVEDALSAGAALPKVLYSPRPGGRDGRDILRFLQGMPAPREYFPGSVRYLKTALRNDAFKCQLAASRVAYRPHPGSPALTYRRVLWLCDEVPFGVLQIEDTIVDPRENTILFKLRLTASGSSRQWPAASGREPAKPATIQQPADPGDHR